MPNCANSSGTDTYDAYICITCDAGANASSNYTWNSTNKRCELVENCKTFSSAPI